MATEELVEQELLRRVLPKDEATSILWGAIPESHRIDLTNAGYTGIESIELAPDGGLILIMRGAIVAAD